MHAGRRCAPSCVDADKTWSITGALGVMAAALPARAGLRYLLTAVGAFVGMSLVHTGSRRLLGVQRSTVPDEPLSRSAKKLRLRKKQGQKRKFSA
ncbi:MAG: hypothetical protein ACPIOQ_68455, partial [Promethearchaeia archaeon]